MKEAEIFLQERNVCRTLFSMKQSSSGDVAEERPLLRPSVSTLQPAGDDCDTKLRNNFPLKTSPEASWWPGADRWTATGCLGPVMSRCFKCKLSLVDAVNHLVQHVIQSEELDMCIRKFRDQIKLTWKGYSAF